MSENQKIPILKKEETVDVSLNFNQIGAIAQAVFLIASNWQKHEPEKVEQFKSLLEKREPITDVTMACFLYLDLLYKTVIKKAEEEGKVEYVDFANAINPLDSSNPLSLQK